MVTKDAFKNIADTVQQKHQDYFDTVPFDPEKTGGIHDHFYIFASADGAKLRFQSDSDLPEKIRSELQKSFDEFTRVKR
jgi:hypothetical protein